MNPYTAMVERLNTFSAVIYSICREAAEMIEAQASRIAELVQARDDSVSLITAERERMDRLVESLQRELAAARAELAGVEAGTHVIVPNTPFMQMFIAAFPPASQTKEPR